MRPTPQPTHRVKARDRRAAKRRSIKRARATRRHLMEPQELI